MNKEINKGIEKIKQWDRSLEGIYYAFGGFYLEGSHENERAVVETIQKLPDKVREWVCSNCSFVIAGGIAFGPLDNKDWLKERRPWNIFIAVTAEKESLPFTIAHEIAHAWLGHKTFINTISPEPPSREKEADEQAKKWGFKEPKR